MTIPRSLASVLFIGLIPFFVGCGSDKKTNTNANSWVGRTYLLDIPYKHWREPPGASDDIGPSVPKFLLDVKSGSGNTLEVLLGTGDANGVQDMCSPTSVIQATSQYPGIQMGPANVPLLVGDKANTSPVIATVYQLTMTDVLAEAAGAPPQATSQLSAILDAREVYPIFWRLTDATPDSVCAALANLDSSAACTACPGADTGIYCLKLRANGLAAGPLSGVTVKPIAESDLPASCSSSSSDGGT